MRIKSEPKQRRDEQHGRPAQARAKIDHVFPAFIERAHECFAIRAQHVDRGNHHAPKREHGGDLENVEALHFPAVLKRAEENHDLGGEVSETGKTDRGERGKPEGETGERHHFSEPAEIFEPQACPVRLRISPAMAKSSAMESPCANIRMAAPVVPRMLALAMPRKM